MKTLGEEVGNLSGGEISSEWEIIWWWRVTDLQGAYHVGLGGSNIPL